MRNVHPIVFIADEEYATYLPSNLHQISKFAPKNQVVYIITTSDTLALNFKRLQDNFPLLKIYGKKVELLDFFESFTAPKGSHVSEIALLKFFLCEILDNENYILYLDVDTLICEPLLPLLSYCPSSAIAATEELGVNAYLRDEPTPYFNSGVMVMSLNRIRELNLGNLVRRLANANQPSRNYMDQDIFNELFRENLTFLPQKYNVFIRNLKLLNLGSFVKSPVIIHFVGQDKPWNYPRKSRYSKLWTDNFFEGTKVSPTSREVEIRSTRGVDIHFPWLRVNSREAKLRLFSKIRSLAPTAIKNFLRHFF